MSMTVVELVSDQRWKRDWVHSCLCALGTTLTNRLFHNGPTNILNLILVVAYVHSKSESG